LLLDANSIIRLSGFMTVMTSASQLKKHSVHAAAAVGRQTGMVLFIVVLTVAAGSMFRAQAAGNTSSRSQFAPQQPATTSQQGLSVPGDVEQVELPGKIGSLKGAKPLPRDVSAYIADPVAAQQLGKALFWDVQVGSSGTACASCHFHAGADIRTKNQVNPGIKGGDGKFAPPLAGASALGPNKQLTASDFPFHKLANPGDRLSAVVATTDDVVSSQGSLGGDYISSTRDFLSQRRKLATSADKAKFKALLPGAKLGNETCALSYDAANNQFHTGNLIHRRVEPRQTPSTVNAVFNYRQFWDGRANNQFNGVDPFGARTFQLPAGPNEPGNPDALKAGTLLLDKTLPASAPQLRLTQILIDNASLASQAVGPALSDFEMSCGGKSFADLGRKLIAQRALASQKVAADDSLFSQTKGLVAVSGQGLSKTYRELIERAFKPEYWSVTDKVSVTATGGVVADLAGHTQMESNFSLFWGLAVQEYEALLVSDDSPFDRAADGDKTAMSAEAKAGQLVFLGKGGCVGCHQGPAFSTAAFTSKDAAKDAGSPKVLERMRQGTGDLAFYDAGFYNIGVRPTAEDPGNGAKDGYGFDLSYARQYKWQLLSKTAKSPDKFDPTPCKWLHQFWPCASVPTVADPLLSERDAADGAFKTPILRNVGLSPPYFHNGGQATLKDVVRFYNRGGDRRGPVGTDTSGSGAKNAFGHANTSNLAPDIGDNSNDFPSENNALGMTEPEMDYLVQFLLSLTDDRVACHSGVFDHPELPLPMGHDEVAVPGTPVARDIVRILPATGKGGLKAAGRACLPNSGDLFGTLNKTDLRPLQPAFETLMNQQLLANGKRITLPAVATTTVPVATTVGATTTAVTTAGTGSVTVPGAVTGVGGKLLGKLVSLVTPTPPVPLAPVLPDVVPTAAPFVPLPKYTLTGADVRGFEAIGFIQEATVSDTSCPGIARRQRGGTALINGMRIVIPCNTIVQMPAATFTWAELFPAGQGGVGADGVSLVLPNATDAAPVQGKFLLPSTEMRVVGNTVGAQHIAGLVFISQQSLNTGTGFITGFDYENGVILLGAKAGALPTSRLQLNDEKGRFSKGQSPDPRFNVDDANPTIRAQTGYPMCIPRVAPDAAQKIDDPLCPKRNRPLVGSKFGCRKFIQAQVRFRLGFDLAIPRPGQVYCSSFVMGDPNAAKADEPTSFQQAPFQIGDYITYSGTLLKGDRLGPDGSDTISVHTIIANVGIYTQPGTLPVYLAMDEFRIGTFDQQLVANGVVQEAKDRLILNAVVTDVTSIVDIYLVDVGSDGKETQRWVTPGAMTFEVGAPDAQKRLITGGITTQLTGAVPGRVRLAAGRAPNGLLDSPTRYMRIVARSLCDPGNINGMAAPLRGAATARMPCLDRAIAANELRTGHYLAPVTNFIFPENVNTGDRPVPFNFWSLGFLANGEGLGTGPPAPTPW
jgi:cytochrome c peroxidase